MGINRTTFVGALLAGLFLAAGAPVAWAQSGSGTTLGDPNGQVGFKSELTLDVKDQPLTTVVNYIRTHTGKNLLLGKNPQGKNLKDAYEVTFGGMDMAALEKAWEQYVFSL